jgi:hypothetical protein
MGEVSLLFFALALIAKANLLAKQAKHVVAKDTDHGLQTKPPRRGTMQPNCMTTPYSKGSFLCSGNQKVAIQNPRNTHDG